MAQSQLPLFVGHFISLDYGKSKAVEFFTSQGYEYTDITTTSDITRLTQSPLISLTSPQSRHVNILILDDEKVATKLMTLWSVKHESVEPYLPEVRRYVGQGLFIILDIKTTTKVYKSFKTFLDKLGVRIQEPSKDKKEEVTSLIEELHLAHDMELFLYDFIGEDYESLLPIVANLKKLTLEERTNLTYDELLSRLPSISGKVTPWGDFTTKKQGLDDLAMAGNLGGALDLLRRVDEGGMNPLVYSGWYVKKVSQVLQLKLLMSIINMEDSAHVLGLASPVYYGTKGKDPYNNKSGYPTKLMIDKARRVDILHAMALLEVLPSLYSRMRGDTSQPYNFTPYECMENMVIQTSRVFSGQAVMLSYDNAE